MADFNQVNLIGRLTRDPELRALQSGTPLCEFGVAIGRKYKDKQTGQMLEETTFVDVTVWGRQAETCSKYLEKGRLVFITGRLKYDSWQDKESGKKRSKLTVIGENVQFLDSQKQQQQNPNAVPPQIQKPQWNQQQQPPQGWRQQPPPQQPAQQPQMQTQAQQQQPNWQEPDLNDPPF